MFFFYLGASTSNPFPQDPVYPRADVPFTLHRDNWRTIRTRHSCGNRVQDWYNYRVNSLNMGELVGDVERIFQAGADLGFFVRKSKFATSTMT